VVSCAMMGVRRLGQSGRKRRAGRAGVDMYVEGRDRRARKDVNRFKVGGRVSLYIY